MKLISIDLVIILFVLYFINKFKFNTRFIKYLLKNIQVFLPPSDKDYQEFLKLRETSGKKVKGVFRKCDIKEYIEHVRDENYIDTELLIYFYQTSFLSLILIEIKKFFIIEEDLNVSSYFAFITIFYIIGKMHTSFSDQASAKKDYRKYLICFLIVFTTSFLIYNFEILRKCGIEFEFIKIHHNDIMKIVEDRIHKILDSTDNNDKADLISKYSNSFIIFLYFSIFSFAFSVNFNVSNKEAMLDDVLITNVEKNNNLNKYSIQNQTLEKLRKQDNKSINNSENEFNQTDYSNEDLQSEGNIKALENVGIICKLKIIMRIILAILLFDHLFKNILTDNKLISELSFRLFLVPAFIIVDLLLTSKCLRYHCMNYLLGNYFVMLEAIEDPKRINLEMIRNHCNISLKNFWKFFSHLFINTYIPLLIYFSFLNRSDIYYKLNTDVKIKYENYTFFTGFLETILYITFSGFILARCIISITFFSYYQIFVKNSKLKIL